MHIVPLIVGEERAAMSLCEAALRRGVFAQAIRPPTVAPGTSRLRLAVMASHTADELRWRRASLGEAARELDHRPGDGEPGVTRSPRGDEGALERSGAAGIRTGRPSGSSSLCEH